MKSKIDIKKYKEQRDYLRNRFEADKMGDQVLFTDQSKLFKPIIESQKETSKAIQDKLAASNDILVPFTKELEKRNNQLDTMYNLPFYSVPEIEVASTPKKSKDQDMLVIDVN